MRYRKLASPAPRRASLPRSAQGVAERLRIAWLAFVVLALYGLPLFHLTLVPHGICEHGHLVHAHGRMDEGAATRSTDRDSEVVPRATTASEHDHCSIAAIPATEPSREFVPELRTIEYPRVLSAAPGCAPYRPIAVLWLAPKASPPLA